VAPGVVLIGDAAGHNDPIIGQGTSITLRDVRIVRDILRAGDWREAAFEGYVVERLERMRRLRIAARFATVLRAEFGPGKTARRVRAFHRVFAEKWPSPLAAPWVGPENLPLESYHERRIAALLSE